MTWIVPPEWLGDTAFILGCGPSLAKTHTAALRGQHVIAINDSYLRAPWASVLYFCDGLKWWNANKDEVTAHFRGRYLVTSYSDGIPPKIPSVHTLHLTGAEGLEDDPGCLRHGSNSGYQAINLAYHFGARRIVLLGMDMRADNGHCHWRTRPQQEPSPESFHKTLQRHMLPKFQSLVEPLRKAGVEVINCTPGSALTVFPMRQLEEVLSADSV